MNRYCASCGKSIRGPHIVKENGLRFHGACWELYEDGPRVAEPTPREPGTTQTYQDIESLLDKLRD